MMNNREWSDAAFSGLNLFRFCGADAAIAAESLLGESFLLPQNLNSCAEFLLCLLNSGRRAGSRIGWTWAVSGFRTRQFLTAGVAVSLVPRASERPR